MMKTQVYRVRLPKSWAPVLEMNLLPGEKQSELLRDAIRRELRRRGYEGELEVPAENFHGGQRWKGVKIAE